MCKKEVLCGLVISDLDQFDMEIKRFVRMIQLQESSQTVLKIQAERTTEKPQFMKELVLIY